MLMINNSNISLSSWYCQGVGVSLAYEQRTVFTGYE